MFLAGLARARAVKSSIARELEALLAECYGISAGSATPGHSAPVTVLDGDVAHTHRSTELGYSPGRSRERNIRRPLIELCEDRDRNTSVPRPEPGSSSSSPVSRAP